MDCQQSSNSTKSQEESESDNDDEVFSDEDEVIKDGKTPPNSPTTIDSPPLSNQKTGNFYFETFFSFNKIGTYQFFSTERGVFTPLNINNFDSGEGFQMVKNCEKFNL